MALARSGERRPLLRNVFLAFGVAGAALLYGDGAITPAISALGAVEGMTIAAPSLEYLVVPVTCVILLALFVVQRRGTAAVGLVFGPIGRYGFMDQPDAPDLLLHSGLINGLRDATFFLGQKHLLVSEGRRAWRWRMLLFSVLSRLAQPATRFFNIPPSRVMEVGIQIVS
jgi:K+ transporter